MDRKGVLLANKVVFEFIMSLSELELEELLKKNKKLALVKCKDIIIDDNSKTENKKRTFLKKIYYIRTTLK